MLASLRRIDASVCSGVAAAGRARAPGGGGGGALVLQRRPRQRVRTALAVADEHAAVEHRLVPALDRPGAHRFVERRAAVDQGLLAGGAERGGAPPHAQRRFARKADARRRRRRCRCPQAPGERRAGAAGSSRHAVSAASPARAARRSRRLPPAPLPPARAPCPRLSRPRPPRSPAAGPGAGSTRSGSARSPPPPAAPPPSPQREQERPLRIRRPPDATRTHNALLVRVRARQLSQSGVCRTVLIWSSTRAMPT